MRLFDVLGPVMIGPSSSHTAGAAKIGYTAQKLLGEVPAQADIGLYGSFATTGKGHGTDRALVAGLLGLRPDDPRLPDSFALAAQRGMQFSIHPVELRSAHPNTAVLTLTSRTGRQLSLKAASVGGGRIRVTEIDGVPADFGGDSNTLIIHNEDGRLCGDGAGVRLPHPPRAGTAAGGDAGSAEGDLPERGRAGRNGGMSHGIFVL